MNKKKILIIVLAILILLLTGVLLYWFVFKNNIFNNSDDNVISHTQLDQEEVENEVSIPSYEAKDITEIYPDIIEKASNWSKDYRIFSITATTRYIQINNENKYFGTDGGKFSSWMAEIYSPTKKATVLYSYSGDSSSLSEEILVTSDYMLPAYANKPFFNSLSDLKSTEDILSVAISNGLNTQGSHVYMYMGDTQTINKYGARYVWRIDQRSNTDLDSNGIPVVNNTFYIDGKTLEFLTSSKL